MINLKPESNEELKTREERVKKRVEEFTSKPKELIEGKKVEDLIDKGGINPYLVNALGFQDIKECVEWVLIQTIGRSLVTSFGFVLEDVISFILGGEKPGNIDSTCNARIPNNQKPWFCWWDVVIELPFEEENKKLKGIVLSVKSGPADMNKDQVDRFAAHAREAGKNGYRPYLILVYGKKASDVIISNLNNQGFSPDKYLRVGKEIFEEFFGDPNYYKKFLDLFKQGGLEEDLFKLIEISKEKLTNELNEMYPEGLEKLLDDTLKGEETEDLEQTKLS